MSVWYVLNDNVTSKRQIPSQPQEPIYGDTKIAYDVESITEITSKQNIVGDIKFKTLNPRLSLFYSIEILYSFTFHPEHVLWVMLIYFLLLTEKVW